VRETEREREREREFILMPQLLSTLFFHSVALCRHTKFNLPFCPEVAQLGVAMLPHRPPPTAFANCIWLHIFSAAAFTSDFLFNTH